MSSNDSALIQPHTWLSPWNYPTRVNDTLAIQIATEVWHGADWRVAGMKYGVAPTRLTAWLKWGAEAYARDGDGNDRHADYLNLFLKLLQATGLAAVPAQQQTYIEAPGWWLTHNPEQRTAWGASSATQTVSPLDAEPSDVETSLTPSPLPTPSIESKRAILKMLIESGAAIGRDDLDETAGAGGSADPSDQLNAG